MKAKFYIYRNLRTKGFSVRHLGRVIYRGNSFKATNVTFKVNELGRERVLKEKQKNVHAFVVADTYYTTDEDVDKLPVITYNPYTNSQFVCDGKKINTAQEVFFKDGKCYLLSEISGD